MYYCIYWLLSTKYKYIQIAYNPSNTQKYFLPELCFLEV